MKGPRGCLFAGRVLKSSVNFAELSISNRESPLSGPLLNLLGTPAEGSPGTVPAGGFMPDPVAPGDVADTIGPREISDAVTERGLELNKSEVIMGEGPIRYTGEHDVLVHLHADVETQIKVTVNPEQ